MWSDVLPVADEKRRCLELLRQRGRLGSTTSISAQQSRRQVVASTMLLFLRYRCASLRRRLLNQGPFLTLRERRPKRKADRLH